jgi:hypothetical protein
MEKGEIKKLIREALLSFLKRKKHSVLGFLVEGLLVGKGGWVDCNSPIRKDGKITGYKPCGREKGEKRAKYPSCRPTPAGCKDKGKGKSWGKKK